MSYLNYQIFVKQSAGRGEKEPMPNWQELPKNERGVYATAILWEGSDLGHEYEEVTFAEMDDIEYPAGGTGIHIFSSGTAEVWCGNHRLLAYDEDITTEQGARLIHSSTYGPGKAGVELDKPGQSVELAIKFGGQIVREVKIVSVASE